MGKERKENTKNIGTSQYPLSKNKKKLDVLGVSPGISSQMAPLILWRWGSLGAGRCKTACPWEVPSSHSGRQASVGSGINGNQWVKPKIWFLSETIVVLHPLLRLYNPCSPCTDRICLINSFDLAIQGRWMFFTPGSSVNELGVPTFVLRASGTFWTANSFARPTTSQRLDMHMVVTWKVFFCFLCQGGYRSQGPKLPKADDSADEWDVVWVLATCS